MVQLTILPQFYPQGSNRLCPRDTAGMTHRKPKVSVRWQPLDPKWIGAITLRGSYSEAFHAPTLLELTPASTQNFAAGS